MCFPWGSAKTLSLDQPFHHAEQFVFGFKADARNFRKANIAVFHGEAVRESTKGLEDSRVRFVASQSQSSSDVQRHLVATVRNATSGRPPVLSEHVENAEIFDQTVTERAI